MEVAFGTVVIVIAALAVLIACLSFIGSGRSYERIGRSGLSLDDSAAREPMPSGGSPAHDAEAMEEEEIRQMLEAKSARLQARGEAPLDVEAEAQRLTAPTVDEGLRDELRGLVTAANERRARRGEAPLEVEAEVDRRLRELGA